MLAIELENVSKSFGEFLVLNNVSAGFEAEKIHGIIGSNGSGKTVLFKCVCGLMYPDKGKILINGENYGLKKRAPQSIGVIIESPGFLPQYSGYRNLKFLADINRKVRKEEIRETMRTVGLDPDEGKHVGKYSMGMRQRLGLAQALMEDPDIIILDEPMNGLDKNGVDDMRKLLDTLRGKHKTILLASHNAEDIHILCDTVWEMESGVLTKCSSHTSN